MKKGTTLVIAVTCLMIAGGWLAGKRDRGGAPTDVPKAAAHETSSSGPQAGAAMVTTPQTSAAGRSESLDDRPLAEVRAELERRAQAGDARAASRLGQAFLHCNKLPILTDDKIDDAIVEVSARGGNILGELGVSLSPADQSSLLKAMMRFVQARCANAQGLDEADASAQALRWVERAAALGDADAQALYGGAVLNAYDVRSAIAGAETLRDRLRQAREYVASSLARGDALALLQTQAYLGNGIYPPNPEAAYAHLYAYSLTPRSGDLPPELLAVMLSDASRKLDAGAIDRAREQGRRLAACCGAGGGARR